MSSESESDKIVVSLGPGGWLGLFCDDAAFDHLRLAVLKEAQVEGIEPKAVQRIEILVNAPAHPGSKKRRVQDRIALIGCALLCVFFGGVFTAGIVAIWAKLSE